MRHILGESDGVDGEFGLGLLSNVDRIRHDNVELRTSEDFRELYMPFDGLVFFADAGNGDQFALSLSGNCEVYVWDHENDSRHAKTAQALLLAGAQVDARDRFGKTPLSVALFNVRNRDGEVIRVLLASGADPDLENNHGISPRRLAETVANYDLKRFLD